MEDKMTRQQRRFQLREAKKDLEKLQKSKFFQNLMKDKWIDEIAAEDLFHLQNKSHTDKKLQSKFNLSMDYLRAVATLESKIELLSKHE